MADPSYAVLVEFEARELLPSFPRDSVCHAQARVVARDPKTGRPLKDAPPMATLSWRLVEYGAAVDAGLELADVADAHPELAPLHDAMFDDEGSVRHEIGEIAAIGHDLVVVDRIEVAPELDFQKVGGALLDHVLAHFTGGCIAAVYLEQGTRNAKARELVLGRNFRAYPQGDWAFFLLDLGLEGGHQHEPTPGGFKAQ